MEQDLPLWHHLRKEASPQDAATVEALATYADGLLRRVRDRFPSFTLHDGCHSDNVTRLIGEILGSRVANLSDLECGMLILAAWYHDVGMVYDEAEVAAITREEQFATFLKDHPAAFLAVRQHGDEPPPEVTEAYLRSRHAHRVDVHLESKDVLPRLRWSEVPIKEQLGMLCRSHGLPVEKLHESDFHKPFLGRCDLRLCALLLRLADILDFDKSRTPRALYTHLDLGRHATRRAAVSDREWRKHMVSGGFVFPSRRPAGYALPFVAAPDHPSVEHDVRQFLDVIEDELRRGRQLLDVCSAKWQKLVLPGSIERQIVSDGYKYGEFRFELDRSAVLDLFVGERLYEDQLTFVRELLQNAMDAVRLRVHLHGGPETAKVEVSCWEEDTGFVWLRIDDSGVGMDEAAIRSYFLQVGRSYYRSDELAADLLRHTGPARDFLGISRFGIGVLSCFIVGDRVEVSTRRVRADGTLASPVRLSLDSSEEFYTLRAPGMSAPPMPGRLGSEAGFRTAPGTSLAVRIDPTKADVSVATLAERLAAHVFCPPVPVLLNGRPCEEAPAELLETPWLDGPKVINIGTPERLRPPAEPDHRGDQLPYLGPLQVVLLPLDLTRASPSPDLHGQLVALVACQPALDQASRDLFAGWPAEALAGLPAPVRELLGSCVRSQTVRLEEDYRGLVLTVRRKLDRDAVDAAHALASEPGRRSPPALRVPATRAPEPDADRPADLGGLLEHVRRSPVAGNYNVSFEMPLRIEELIPAAPARLARSRTVRWGHNGVTVSSRVTVRASTDLPAFQNRQLEWAALANPSDLLMVGAVGLRDRLRPETSISRDTVHGLPFELHSAVQLAVRRAAGGLAPGNGKVGAAIRRVAAADLLRLAPTAPFRLATLREDPLLSDGEWSEEPVLRLQDDAAGRSVDSEAALVSAAELRRRVRRTGLVELASMQLLRVGWKPEWSPRWSDRFEFSERISAAVAQLELDLGWEPASGRRRGQLWVASGERPELPDGLDWFPPLFFVPYTHDHEHLLRSEHFGPVNQRHPTARWLIDHAPRLQIDLPAVFHRICRALRPEPQDEASARDEINDAIDQVTRADPDLAAPADAYVTGSDDRGALW